MMVVLSSRHRHASSSGRTTRGFFGRLALLGLHGSAIFVPAMAHAQSTTTLIQPVISPDYGRDRNVSVLERQHPDFAPLGYRLGNWILNPSLTVSPGVTNNVYNDNDNRQSDAFVIVEPNLRISSDWAVHRLILEATGDLRRYAQASVRNQDGWKIDASGRLDVSQDLFIEASGTVGRRFESPFSDDVINNTTNVSSYLQSLAYVKASYTVGRTRLVGAVDRSSYTFNRVTFADRPARDQRSRDRTMDRLTGIIDYALSPSLSMYGQIVLDRNEYDALIENGQANRDSTGYMFVGGVNFDLAGLMRGSIGTGYSRRDYKSEIYPDASGLSVQAKVEFFPTPLTTVGFTAQRQIQDAGLGGAGAYLDNRATMRVDHELLENLVLTLDGDVARRSYEELDQRTDVISVGAAARFQMTRGLSFGGNIRYGSSTPNGNNLGNAFDEFRAIVSVRIRR
jgi:hypothetical protein